MFLFFLIVQQRKTQCSQPRLDASAGSWSIGSVQTTTLAVGSPRDFILRDELETVAVVSGAASSSVAVVSLADAGGFDSPRYIDAGGLPTDLLMQKIWE